MQNNCKTSIIQAKVPIIKAIYNDTNLHLDISLGGENGSKDSKIFSYIISKHTILKQAITVLKMFAKINE